MYSLVLTYGPSFINAGYGRVASPHSSSPSMKLSWVPSEPPGKQDLMGPQLKNWTLTPAPPPRVGTVRSLGRVTRMISAACWLPWTCLASPVRTRTASSAS